MVLQQRHLMRLPHVVRSAVVQAAHKLAFLLQQLTHRFQGILGGRYRIVEGRLQVWYELVRPDKVLEEAYEAVRKTISAGIGEVPMYEATL